jgi:hypothetical protein
LDGSAPLFEFGQAPSLAARALMKTPANACNCHSRSYGHAWQLD